MIIATEEYHGVAGGSFEITLARPALSFAQDLLCDICSGKFISGLHSSVNDYSQVKYCVLIVHLMRAGDKALAENLAVVLRSRDPAKLRAEVGPNKKVYLSMFLYVHSLFCALYHLH